MALSDRVVVMNGGRVIQVGPPEETYERPATAFVANFLGRTNMLRGSVAGGRLTVGGIAFPHAASQSGAVRVAVRPEKVRFAPDGLPGRMTARIFQGSHWLCEVETAAGAVAILHPNSGAGCPAEGDGVTIAWRLEDMHVSSEGGGEA